MTDWLVAGALQAMQETLDRLTSALEATNLASLGSTMKEGQRMSEYATESKSSAAVTANAKGDAQSSVKAYEGVTEEEMARLVKLAADSFIALQGRLAGKVALP